MTLEEYDIQMRKASEELNANWSDELYKSVSEFQFEHMEEFIKEYGKTIDDDPAKKVCFDLLYYAVHNSESGSSIEYVETKELADRVEEIIENEIGQYLLDSPQIYQSGDEWAIDCMFGGNYVPYWDGWKED